MGEGWGEGWSELVPTSDPPSCHLSKRHHQLLLASSNLPSSGQDPAVEVITPPYTSLACSQGGTNVLYDTLAIPLGWYKSAKEQVRCRLGIEGAFQLQLLSNIQLHTRAQALSGATTRCLLMVFCPIGPCKRTSGTTSLVC